MKKVSLFNFNNLPKINIVSVIIILLIMFLILSIIFFGCKQTNINNNKNTNNFEDNSTG